MVYNARVSTPLLQTDPEIASLSARYGEPCRLHVALSVGTLFSAVNVRPERTAEVVFAIVRPSGRLLVHTKAFYPPGAFRLPSGSIQAGEPVEAALRREVAEETSLQVEVVRFLAVVSYDLKLPQDAVRQFTSYVFLLREVGGSLTAADENERVAGFREILPSELPALAQKLESLASSPKREIRSWGDWGRFRAVAHRVVWDALREPGKDAAGTT